MKLIIGGAYQGKLNYTRKLLGNDNIEAAEGDCCSFDEVFSAPVIHNFHLFVERLLVEERDIPSFLDILIKSNPGVVIITDEIGYGIVPVDEDERKNREGIGRACCQLAKVADEVHRVICGIGTVIKG